jgi:hypothetical protein
MRWQHPDHAHAGRGDAATRHRELERKDASAGHDAPVVPGRVHTRGWHDLCQTCHLIVARRRAAEIVPDGTHGVALLGGVTARPYVPAHDVPPRRQVTRRETDVMVSVTPQPQRRAMVCLLQQRSECLIFCDGSSFGGRVPMALLDLLPLLVCTQWSEDEQRHGYTTRSS